MMTTNTLQSIANWHQQAPAMPTEQQYAQAIAVEMHLEAVALAALTGSKQ